ncbi:MULTISPECIES: prephenate dehydratase [unclassified Polaromonas]|jgi:chorismate mutase/prephenate dehydratase|uniref:prephenate dehydratase n=1 Tax=unclassified Polaromonas TaxID=2638319 RepID=UPI0018C8E1E9|nr:MULTISPECIES: prephenate dehydratase [unclassified Polaromonas]MBG6073851.1 chorismate mutase/prephenate dehydratase [Polaromonas sp. CG_9.7]MBG6115710.1 chorismate mutase/prephenate dehydratase [Polaromonas sp. CG_9.2]MDH6185903.1 chorismate mutase/prephenate dehydratase [Polaromonas sp. CG_23.6]
MTANLADLRVQIDALDKQLLTLLNQRALVAEQVGEVKKREGTPFFRPDRVAQVIEKIQQTNQGPLKNEHVAAVWREIMSACLALESPVRVAYLGPVGTFSEEAAVQFFGSSIEHVPCTSFDEVFRAATAGTAEYGVVPVENSTEGVVSRSLDLLLNSPLHIVGEISLMVRHNLLRLSDSLEGIEVVFAHPQALAQCQGWLTTHLPHAERRAASSNAEGARLATTHPAWAGIASARAATQFSLHTAAHAIQDDAFNRTRFAVVCLPQTLPTPPPSGKDCTSLVVSVPNQPGAVHDILVPLKTHGVSMTRFESRPARSGQWEYYFYIDLQGHRSQAHVKAALADLQQLCAFYKILGTYPVTD